MRSRVAAHYAKGFLLGVPALRGYVLGVFPVLSVMSRQCAQSSLRGTGAGFPGVPRALACPEMRVTLMDAQKKRLNFLQAVIDDLQVRNVTLVHARAEDAAQFPQHREKYDVAVARAVAPLAVLSEYLLPFVRVGGKAVCWKGPALSEELTQGRRAAHLLGGRVEEPVNVAIPGRDWQHMLLPVSKTAKTARQYPRKAGTPGKAPLGQSGNK